MRSPGEYIPENPGRRRGRKRGEEGPAELLAKLERLIQALVRPAEAVWDAKDGLQDFWARLLESGSPLLPHGPSRSARRSMTSKAVPGKRAALPSASDVQIHRDGDGWADVTVLWSQRVRLSPAMASLLETLCSQGSGCTSGDLVAWKTLIELTDRLREKTGRNLDPHAVAVRIHRLRAILEACGINQLLVQTDRRQGFRFAKKAKPAQEIGGNLR